MIPTPCTKCGYKTPQLEPTSIGGRWVVVCGGCGSKGAPSPYRRLAIKSWNLWGTKGRPPLPQKD